MKNGMGDLFEIVPIEEHAFMRNIHEVSPEEMKMLHCNGLMISNVCSKIPTQQKHSRGLACLLFDEFYKQITKVLEQKEMKEIFTELEFECCMAQQCSLFDFDKIQKTKSADGHFQFRGTNTSALNLFV